MSAAANTAEPTQHPDPPQDQAPIPESTRTTRLLGVVQALIAFGKQLAATLQSSPSADTLFWITGRFGTTDIKLILARITRGLRLAAALETKLASRADRAQPIRASGTSSPRKPRSRRPETPRQNNEDSVLANLPTSEEIAEQLRRYPVHVVLRKLCSDLGIIGADPLWQDIQRVLDENGGSSLALWKEMMDRTAITNFLPPDTPIRLPPPSQWPELRYGSILAASAQPP